MMVKGIWCTGACSRGGAFARGALQSQMQHRELHERMRVCALVWCLHNPEQDLQQPRGHASTKPDF